MSFMCLYLQVCKYFYIYHVPMMIDVLYKNYTKRNIDLPGHDHVYFNFY